MYRHMLVPIDGTELSIHVIGQAVALAHAVGARITFFHAAADGAGSLHGDLDVLRLTSPQDYDYAVAGKTRELLAKAEAAARALGVPCESASTLSSKPAQAIIAAARGKQCDLIFMASHGHHGRIGMALGSETLSVLLNSGLPVLVCATGEPAAPQRAIAIIRDEHRSMAAVLHAWTQLLADARSASGEAADVEAMRTILDYLRNFPLALHHPKEEVYLFRLLRTRTHSADAELEELERQHERDRILVDELAQRIEALDRAANDSKPSALEELERAVARYADFHWEHMGREEAVILPAAQRHLTAADWDAIGQAFAQDPGIRLGGETDLHYRHLVARIVTLSAERRP
jgi:nucleotide-binding universal stress UspA family protein/hemerythrin-like domain-containing protein